MKKTKKWLSCIIAITMVLVIVPMNAFATTETTTIDATDGAELFTLVEQAVTEGATKIQVNVSGTLNYEIGASHTCDKLTNLEGLEELTIVGTASNAKFVQTGVGVAAMSVNGGKLIFKNITIEDTTVYTYENGESAWEFCYAEYAGDVEFNNCVIRGEYGGIMTNGTANFVNCSFIGEKDSSHGGNEYAVWVNNESATFTNCTFTGNRAVKTHEAYGTNVTSVTIDNCVFNNITQKPGVAIGTLDSDTVITIKNSDFIGCKAGDDNQYIYESDSEITDYTLILEGNVVCNEHTTENFTKVDAVEATYTAAGNIEYWTCTCGNWYKDREGNSKITDKNSVVIPQLVAVNSGKAEVTENAVTDAIENSGTSETVTLPLEDTKETVTSVELPVESLDAVASANKTLTVETSTVIVTLDKVALETIVEKAGSNATSITLEVVEITEETLNDEQKAAIEDKEVAAVISAEIICNGKNVSNFGGGKVTVKIPFTPAEGTEGTDYKVFYIANDGKVEEIATTYVDGNLVVELEHFSNYVIAKTTTNNDTSNNSTNPPTGDSSSVWFAIFLISVVGMVATVVYSKKRV